MKLRTISEISVHIHLSTYLLAYLFICFVVTVFVLILNIFEL